MSQKELLILRHAKSSWDEPDKEDIDRALISRGVNDAIFMAKRLKKHFGELDLIITSPANRAVHTTLIFCRVANFPLEKVQINYDVYESSESTLIKIIKNTSDDLNKIMIVGHNPTLTYFVNNFIDKPIDNIPTTGIVGITFTMSSWNEISKSKLKSSFFDYPKKD